MSRAVYWKFELHGTSMYDDDLIDRLKLHTHYFILRNNKDKSALHATRCSTAYLGKRLQMGIPPQHIGG